MALRYMVSDTILAKGERVQPAKSMTEGVRRVRRPRKHIRSPIKGMKFWALLLANVILYAVLCHRWIGDDKSHIVKFFTANRGMLRGIFYHEENPAAIVWGKVVHEGDTIRGYKVVKIHKNKVEFEKEGEILVRSMN
jgi:hypothetical protein